MSVDGRYPVGIRAQNSKSIILTPDAKMKSSRWYSIPRSNGTIMEVMWFKVSEWRPSLIRRRAWVHVKTCPNSTIYSILVRVLNSKYLLKLLYGFVRFHSKTPTKRAHRLWSPEHSDTSFAASNIGTSVQQQYGDASYPTAARATI